MSRALTDAQARRLREASQRLTGPPARKAHEVVRALCAVPAQDTRASRLALRPRSAGLDAAAVARAASEERSVMRTWAMRGTLHALAAEDVGWVVGLLGPIFAAAGRPRRLALGLDDELSDRGVRALREILAAEGPLVRPELARRVAAAGVPIDADGQAPAHLLAYAAMRGVVCRGPETERDEATYVLLEDWTDWFGTQRAVDPERALAELTRRYLAAHGPAGERDYAAWSGIGLRRARRGLALIAGDLDEVAVAEDRAWMLRGTLTASSGSAEPGPRVRLLGAFDPYLLGYRDRALVLDAGDARSIRSGGGMIRPALLVDGRVAGTWRQERRGDAMTVEVQPFRALDPDVLPELESEAADVGRFLGADATLAVGP